VVHLGALIASIPSPSFNQIQLGPLNLRMYGLCIALGVIAAVTISSRRWEARGGNPDDIGTIAIWAVPAGVIGARLYHVATDWKTYEGNWVDALKITQGGLGIPGGILAGVLAGLIVVRVKKLPPVPLLDVVAPAIPVAQAIGRLGNWFNQEVFGRPTTLPWGLEIDPEYRPARYVDSATFHPTFLYEGLWNIALALLLVRLERTKRLRPGELFGLYVLGYAVGRLWVELLRSDNASLILGVRVNVWMSLLVGLLAVAALVRLHRRPLPATPYPSPDTAAEFGVGSVPVAAASDDDDEVEAGGPTVDDGEGGAVDAGDGDGRAGD
jgi:prolipoprotein diacylglyceryl transferase